jgi:hypothetical protein
LPEVDVQEGGWEKGRAVALLGLLVIHSQLGPVPAEMKDKIQALEGEQSAARWALRTLIEPLLKAVQGEKKTKARRPAARKAARKRAGAR